MMAREGPIVRAAESQLRLRLVVSMVHLLHISRSTQDNEILDSAQLKHVAATNLFCEHVYVGGDATTATL